MIRVANMRKSLLLGCQVCKLLLYKYLQPKIPTVFNAPDVCFIIDYTCSAQHLIGCNAMIDI